MVLDTCVYYLFIFRSFEILTITVIYYVCLSHLTLIVKRLSIVSVQGDNLIGKVGTLFRFNYYLWY